MRGPALLAILLGAAASSVSAAPPAGSPAERLETAQRFFPPWQEGANDDAIDKGLDFTVAPVDVMADFHGSLNDPALVLYVSGNYFFALAGLVRAFGELHPEWRGRVFYETLPPGLLLKQIQNGGTVTAGNLTFTARPDVMMAEQRASEAWVAQRVLLAPVVSFATNDLTIMVPAGNPAQVGGLADLARHDLTVLMPNPAWEGVARQARDVLVRAGGEALAAAVYDAKVADGTTILTKIHHRQTPLWLMQGVGQAGLTWTSEAIFQERLGNPIAHILIPEAQNVRAIYSAALVPDPPHPAAARAWIDFIGSDAAFAALAPYGFRRYPPAQ